MISEALSLTGALGAGGAIGLIKTAFQFFREHKSEKAKREFEADLASRNLLVEYRKTIGGGHTEADLSQDSKFKIVIFGQEISYEGNQRKETIVRSLSAWTHGVALLLFVLGLTWLCLIWGDSPSEEVHTFNPTEQPTKFGIGWGLFEWQVHRSEVSVLTTGGLSFFLAHGILGIVGMILTGYIPTKTR